MNELRDAWLTLLHAECHVRGVAHAVSRDRADFRAAHPEEVAVDLAAAGAATRVVDLLACMRAQYFSSSLVHAALAPLEAEWAHYVWCVSRHEANCRAHFRTEAATNAAFANVTLGNLFDNPFWNATAGAVARPRMLAAVCAGVRRRPASTVQLEEVEQPPSAAGVIFNFDRVVLEMHAASCAVADAHAARQRTLLDLRAQHTLVTQALADGLAEVKAHVDSTDDAQRCAEQADAAARVQWKNALAKCLPSGRNTAIGRAADIVRANLAEEAHARPAAELPVAEWESLASVERFNASAAVVRAVMLHVGAFCDNVAPLLAQLAADADTEWLAKCCAEMRSAALQDAKADSPLPRQPRFLAMLAQAEVDDEAAFEAQIWLELRRILTSSRSVAELMSAKAPARAGSSAAKLHARRAAHLLAFRPDDGTVALLDAYAAALQRNMGAGLGCLDARRAPAKVPLASTFASASLQWPTQAANLANFLRTAEPLYATAAADPDNTAVLEAMRRLPRAHASVCAVGSATLGLTQALLAR